MVVQTRRSQAILLSLSVIICLSTGIIGYMYISRSPGVTVDEAQRYAEIVLFLSIVFSIFLAAVFTGVFIRNKNIVKELDKVVEMSLYSNFSPGESLRKLSVIGEKIEHIYRNVSMVSEKRALKISAMHGLNGFLLENLSLPVLVTDVRGEIVSASRQARERFSERPVTPGTYISAVYPELNFQGILEELRLQTSSFTEGRTEKQDLRFYPIRNREREIAYVVCVLGKADVYTMEHPGAKMKQQKNGESKPGIFTRFRRRRNGTYT